ncbi:MAG: hypothetical protein IT545_12605 [Rhodobacteraceae bacterium]|nr:hypothetical protein [Paracoccaceae bacterium]
MSDSPAGPAAKALRIGVIGAGRIATEIVARILSGEAGAAEVVAVLARREGKRPGIDAWVTADRAAFLAAAPGLIVEAAGPEGLRAHGVAALAVADLWSISGMALVDDALVRDLEATGQRTGHRLRLVGGAIAGLDAVAIAARDPRVRVHVDVVSSGTQEGDVPDFAGTAREALGKVHGVNIVAAVAMAGPGLDRVGLRFFKRDPGQRRFFNIRIESDVGNYVMSSSPNLSAETGATHTVASSVIAALVQAQRTIWAG